VFYLWDADSNANFYTDCNSYDYAYADSKRHTYGYSDSYSATESYADGHIHEHAECYCYGYSHSETNAHCPAEHNTEVTSYTGAPAGRTAVIWSKERRAPWPAVASAKAASPPS
jgi:hypothetical protein